MRNDESAKITRVRFEHHREPFGIGEARPRLSWIVVSDQPGWQQSAYEIELLGADGARLNGSGRVDSGQSVLVAWPFDPLTSRQGAVVRVRAWDQRGAVTDWSEAARIEVGLLEPDDWQAQMIASDWEEDLSRPQPCPHLRREFVARTGIDRARLYVTAHGVYEAYLNGTRIGDHVMPPGWTSYHQRLRYQSYDVTALLNEGQNAIGAILGDGWYRGRLSFGGGRRNIYGDCLGLLAQLEITYRDGTVETVVTDERWRAATGPILASDIYDGEAYDARLELGNWALPGFDDRSWHGVRRVERDTNTLLAASGPPVRRIEELAPVAIITSPSGKTLVDFGQNLVGWLRIIVRSVRGQEITLRHAEVLEGGELCTRPLRTAKATDVYISKGEALEVWEPRFTFHGFRYAEVSGWPGELQPEDVRAVVCHTDMERTGWFECSDPLVNRLHENVVWGMRGNFFDVPTDCPQRDERLGWTGDLQVFSPTASFLYDCAGLLASWLKDLAVDQDEHGVVPVVVPNVLPRPPFPAAAWGDAAVIVPWVLYERFGDGHILEEQIESMKGWVDAIAAIAGESRRWDTGFQFGDWLDPAAPPDKPGDARTPGEVVATAYFARSAELVGQSAETLGRAEDADRYLKLAAEVRAAFNAEYVTPNGRILGDSATAYAMALAFTLLTDPYVRQRAGERLRELVEASGYRISTGFVGTPIICDALCSAGAYDSVYRLLMQKECPSWLYPVTMGATTIWERWDSLLPDGSVNPGEMTSFNHYALGAVADWLHRTVAGLTPLAPGYRRIAIQPRPGGGLTWARARHQTPYGMAESGWRIEEDVLVVEVTIPANTTAHVSLPGWENQPFEVDAGQHCWRIPL
ncbi:MAG TPA: glycoside hydrolase family 78 protein [Levilinea sp.]|nr:glycoside hydrolase family 78 protein [Levilinea sp.]